MTYTMRAGTLYAQGKIVAKIKGTLIGTEKQILSPDGRLLLRTEIHNLNAPPEQQGDVQFREYVMIGEENDPFAIGKPDYAEGDGPMVIGWSCCRMPRVDHAQIQVGNSTYCLVMINSQNYLLKGQPGEVVVEIFHRGLTGGWDIEAADELRPEFICGIFVFCRYIEQENEFLIV